MALSTARINKQTTTMTEAMEVDTSVQEEAALHDSNVVEEEEEDVSDLEEALAQAATSDDPIPLLTDVVLDSEKTGPTAVQLRERAVYQLTRAYCEAKRYEDVVQFLQQGGQVFWNQITKAKTAKVVRQVLDIICQAAPEALEMQETVARSIIEWTEKEKRSFLRQRVEAKLAHILFQKKHYPSALELCERLLGELKKLDDKQLLVETHLLESKIHFALLNLPKAKAALTASRTAANAIYVSPQMQADIDNMSGTIHTEEGDYNTAHSYFLEAFEQLDQMNQQEAMVALKYMMLCKILDSLRKALKLSSKGTVGSKSDESLLTGKQSVKYAGRDIDALQAIAKASNHRNLQELDQVLNEYKDELQEDLLIKHHLHILQEQLLESNLIRIIEPYSCVELSHVSNLMEMPSEDIERKLSQMILDGKLQGILDQGKGHLIVYEETEKDRAMEKGLEIIANMDQVVTTLFSRSKSLRTMMI